MQKRVVITSVGVISSIGFTQNSIIENFKKENTCFNTALFDNQIPVCPVKNFDVKKFTGRFKNIRYLNRGAQFCVASAMEAVTYAKLHKDMLKKAGMFAGMGPNLDISGEFSKSLDGVGMIDSKDLPALWILRFLPNTAVSAISGLAGIHGDNLTINTACSASLQAIGEAFRKIKHGYLDLAFAGGGDSRLNQGGILAYKKAHALAAGGDDPEKAGRPFDCNRKGFVPGEGGAFFLLEELEHAKKRGAKIFCEICGYGASMDGYNMTAPDPEGRWSETAVRDALKEAKMLPAQIDIISAHATGTQLNDEMEASLIDRVYGEHKPFVIALKSWIGHVAAACGAVELAICIYCMQNSYLPKIRNLKDPNHKSINFVKTSIACSFDSVMLENFGFGGQNSALVVKTWKE